MPRVKLRREERLLKVYIGPAHAKLLVARDTPRPRIFATREEMDFSGIFFFFFTDIGVPIV